jgi:hypothetical protein
MDLIDLPFSEYANTEHELTGCPSTKTVQLPQTCNSQLTFVPVNPKSCLRNWATVVRLLTHASTLAPLTLHVMS